MLKALSLLVAVTLAASFCGVEGERQSFASDESLYFGTALETTFPLGWYAAGVCTDDDARFHALRDSVVAHLSVFRRHGANTLIEPAAADGRIVPRAESPGWYNWYGYSYVDHDGATRSFGHPRPGAFVEGMRWLLDEAYAGGARDSAISVIVALDRFIAPNYDGDPYDGGQVLGCSEYQGFIDEERRRVARSDPKRAARIPRAACRAGDAERPFWEWNVQYVIANLSGHPGLLAWYLWDEPEGLTYRHLFGIVEDGPPRAYSGPSSLPTPDFIRYTYRLVKDLDRSVGGNHPIIIDIHSPHVFFSDRFSWSVDRRDPKWSSGPFDVMPDGSYGTPADILGLEASAYLSHAQAAGSIDRLPWYWDSNLLSRGSDMLHEVVVADGLQSAIVAAGQAQLPSSGPYAPNEDLRCDRNDASRTRLLSDRDLVWQFLTPLINGLRGYIFYSHAFMPASGPGGRQVMRSNRLLSQFRRAQLHTVLTADARDDLAEVESIHVAGLTDYHRSEFPTDRPGKTDAAARSALSRTVQVEPKNYDVRHFSRSGDERTYGQAAAVQQPGVHLDHRLLRTAVREHEGLVYLFLSNAYDADVIVHVRPTFSVDAIEEAQFDLSGRDTLDWSPFVESQGARAQGARSTRSISVGMRPYEVKVLRIRSDRPLPSKRH